MKLLSGFLRFLSPQHSEPLEPEAESEGLLDREAGPSKEERAKQRARMREYRQRFLSEHPNHPTIEHIVDDRIFLLGLDDLYRERMKRHESTELLACARAVAAKLGVSPADVPIEAYYTETKQLTEYFQLVRRLQEVDKNEAPGVSTMHEFQRLLSVTSAPLYGRPVEGGLLPVGRDPLAQALLQAGTAVDRWTLDSLVDGAHRVAIQSDDFSLVGLACFARDRAVLVALRESVALYAGDVPATLSQSRVDPPIPVYVWRVDDELARRGARFVAAFNELFDDDLPEPVAENADIFFEAADEGDIIGRCICIGQMTQPTRFYHWAIRRGADERPTVEEFWDSQLWTTERYPMRDWMTNRNSIRDRS